MNDLFRGYRYYSLVTSNTCLKSDSDFCIILIYTTSGKSESFKTGLVVSHSIFYKFPNQRFSNLSLPKNEKSSKTEVRKALEKNVIDFKTSEENVDTLDCFGRNSKVKVV